MNVTTLSLEGLLLIEPKKIADQRGWFLEAWQLERYRDCGLPFKFVQDNLAYSNKGVLRGLHSQYTEPQGKLVQVYQGEIFDVAVDIRLGSPTFGLWESVKLTSDRFTQLYIPPGFAHGYYVLSENALIGYKCTEFYRPETEFSIRWSDPKIGIEWPIDTTPNLSTKDKHAPLLSDITTSALLCFDKRK